MGDRERDRLDALLDLLADEIAERLAERRGRPGDGPDEVPDAESPAEPAPVIANETLAIVGSPVEAAVALAPAEAIEGTLPATEAPDEATVVEEPEREPSDARSRPAGPSSLVTRLALGILLIVVAINIPLNAQGLALARSIPSTASLVIRNDMVVKEAASPDIYVYRDEAFHWITSLEAFEHYRYTWEDVHVVEDGFLGAFAKGKPLYVLLKCEASPHIYQAERGTKRWIVDIPTFEAEGYVWRDVKRVPCPQLRALPDGESIPPGRGLPGAPLP